MTAIFGLHLVLVIVSLTLGTHMAVLVIHAMRGSGVAVIASTAEDSATGEWQMQSLRSGVGYAQGFHIGRPEPCDLSSG